MRTPNKHFYAVLLLAMTAVISLTAGCGEEPAPNPQSQRTVLRQDKHFSVNAVDLGKYARLTLNRECADIELVFSTAVTSVEVRPARLGIQARIDGNKVTLLDVEPCKAAVVVNGDYTTPVFLFVDPKAPKEWSDLPANTIRFKKGSHDIGGYELPDGATVFLEEGAVLRGNFLAQGKKDIRILGYGVIDGRDRQKAIRIEQCDNVEVSGPVVMSRNGWMTSYFECDNLRIDNMKMLGSDVYSDGIDLVGCTNVTVNDVFVRNEDDCIAIKTNKYGFHGNVEHITVTNSVFWVGRKGNGLEIGWELDGDYVRDIRFENIDFIRKDKSMPNFYRGMISIHQCGNSKVSDVLYKDIRMESAHEDLVWIELRNGWTSQTPSGPSVWGSGGGTIDNIRFENVVYTAGDEADEPRIRLLNTASSGKEVTRVVFSGLTYKGRTVTDTEDEVFIIDEKVGVKVE